MPITRKSALLLVLERIAVALEADAEISKLNHESACREDDRRIKQEQIFNEADMRRDKRQAEFLRLLQSMATQYEQLDGRIKKVEAKN